MDRLFIDIETIQATDAYTIAEIRQNIKPPGNIKKEESIQKWYAEKLDDAVAKELAKTSFDGFAGQVCSIAWAVNDNDVQVLTRGDSDSDFDLLETFFRTVEQENGINFDPLWVAHNIDFDMKFLYKRLVVNNIKPTIYFPINPKPWAKDVFCTLYNSMGLEMRGGSLSRLARVLGVGQKTEGMDGSMVNQYYLDGKIDEIAQYNKDDVYLCREIYKRLNFITKVEDSA